MDRDDRAVVKAWILCAAALAASCCLAGCGPGEKKPDAAKKYMFFPAPPDVPRVQFLRSLRGEEDFAVKQDALATFLVGEDKEKHKEINKAYGIAVRDGKIFVADTMDASIAVFDLADKSFNVFGKEGRGKLVKPINIRMDSSGRLYVTDTVRKQIVVFDADGNYLAEYGKGNKFKPADVAIYGDELYILDIGAHNIKVYDLKTRELKRTLGKRGKGFGEFNYPTNMVIDDQGYIHVCDSMNIRVQKIDRNGKAVFLFGRPGRTPGHLTRPRGIAVDREGTIFVADAVLGVVQMFDKKGQALMHFGESGTGAGRLYLPAQVIVSYDSLEHFKQYIAPDFKAKYLIFVTNQLGPNKVSVFAYGVGKVPPGAVIRPTTRPTTRPATRPAPTAPAIPAGPPR